MISIKLFLPRHTPLYIHSLIKFFWGFGSYTQWYLMHAFESFNVIVHTEHNKLAQYTLDPLIIANQFNEQMYFYRLLVLLHIRSYRGFRLLFQFPVRGQRTWSNANTIKKLQPILLDFKTIQFNRFTHYKHSRVEVLSEYINFLWFIQWRYEWRKMRNNWRFHRKFRNHPLRFIKYQDIINFRMEHFSW